VMKQFNVFFRVCVSDQRLDPKVDLKKIDRRRYRTIKYFHRCRTVKYCDERVCLSTLREHISVILKCRRRTRATPCLDHVMHVVAAYTMLDDQCDRLIKLSTVGSHTLFGVLFKKTIELQRKGSESGPILSVFFALIVHSELKSVHPGFPVAFIF